MNAIVLSIGDELILGQTVDTNSAWISRQLAGCGFTIAQHLTMDDNRAAIAAAVARAAGDCDLLIITGGLGPTADDLTRDALADALHQPLEIHPLALAQLEAFFQKRNRKVSGSNRAQAFLPRGTSPLENSTGTAPGIEAKLGKCRIFATPGVPSEMRRMFTDHIAPKISELGGGAVILSRILHTFGLPESTVGEKLGLLMDRTRNPSVGTTVSAGLISLRLNANFPNTTLAKTALDQTESLCREALGDLIFGSDEQTLSGVVGAMLAERKQTVAVAESCTGGLLGAMLTEIPGSSRYFMRGWITYSNQSKTEMLGVPEELLAEHGAVSEPVAAAMAAGARQKADVDFALSITGIAGPDGGTPAKPVGTVSFGFSHAGGTDTRTFRLPGDRAFVRLRAANMAMTLLRFHLLGKPLPF